MNFWPKCWISYSSKSHGNWVSEVIKGCVHYIFGSLFFMFKGQHFWNKENVFFISLQKLFSFLRLPDFNFSDIRMSWRHQMPKHDTRNIFYGITWEVNTVLSWNLASLCNITKEKFSSKNYMKNVAWALVPGLF